jgi:hypothetical protein
VPNAEAEKEAAGVTGSLTLLTRAGCSLCEEMAAEIEARIAGTAHRMARLDVDADPDLKARYGWDVPVLLAGDAEMCRHQLNLPAFAAWLRANP